MPSSAAAIMLPLIKTRSRTSKRSSSSKSEQQPPDHQSSFLPFKTKNASSSSSSSRQSAPAQSSIPRSTSYSPLPTPPNDGGFTDLGKRSFSPFSTTTTTATSPTASLRKGSFGSMPSIQGVFQDALDGSAKSKKSLSVSPFRKVSKIDGRRDTLELPMQKPPPSSSNVPRGELDMEDWEWDVFTPPITPTSIAMERESKAATSIRASSERDQKVRRRLPSLRPPPPPPLLTSFGPSPSTSRASSKSHRSSLQSLDEHDRVDAGSMITKGSSWINPDEEADLDEVEMRAVEVLEHLSGHLMRDGYGYGTGPRDGSGHTKTPTRSKRNTATSSTITQHGPTLNLRRQSETRSTIRSRREMEKRTSSLTSHHLSVNTARTPLPHNRLLPPHSAIPPTPNTAPPQYEQLAQGPGQAEINDLMELSRELAMRPGLPRSISAMEAGAFAASPVGGNEDGDSPVMEEKRALLCGRHAPSTPPNYVDCERERTTTDSSLDCPLQRLTSLISPTSSRSTKAMYQTQQGPSPIRSGLATRILRPKRDSSSQSSISDATASRSARKIGALIPRDELSRTVSYEGRSGNHHDNFGVSAFSFLASDDDPRAAMGGMYGDALREKTQTPDHMVDRSDSPTPPYIIPPSERSKIGVRGRRGSSQSSGSDSSHEHRVIEKRSELKISIGPQDTSSDFSSPSSPSPQTMRAKSKTTRRPVLSPLKLDSDPKSFWHDMQGDVEVVTKTPGPVPPPRPRRRHRRKDDKVDAATFASSDLAQISERSSISTFTSESTTPSPVFTLRSDSTMSTQTKTRPQTMSMSSAPVPSSNDKESSQIDFMELSLASMVSPNPSTSTTDRNDPSHRHEINSGFNSPTPSSFSLLPPLPTSTPFMHDSRSQTSNGIIITTTTTTAISPSLRTIISASASASGRQELDMMDSMSFDESVDEMMVLDQRKAWLASKPLRRMRRDGHGVEV
ncbi:hypothetical protein CI109_107370 [Kwoniella shandongensis]|uniref:Uncharacterized protein n=1 Tax=Kwoniella shandongensis TaxID=1734106 RepID=A0A5M6BVN8_9TREE|nr:uncharacterized protein CI109_004702 [Kwoniella shandongensis]KAA5526926.1 hypothetical protein CI109_004702 [Kwoniella shandongensis]